jgi:hypothetical protein
MPILLLLLREGGGQMSIGFVFWFLMLVWLIFGGWSGYALTGPERGRYYGGHFLLFILVFLLGWATFGFPIGG